VDNLDGPLPGAGRVHGSFPGMVLRRSPVTRLLARRARPGDLLTAAVSGYHRWRLRGSAP
jgi:hypothetical protein